MIQTIHTHRSTIFQETFKGIPGPTIQNQCLRVFEFFLFGRNFMSRSNEGVLDMRPRRDSQLRSMKTPWQLQKSYMKSSWLGGRHAGRQAKKANTASQTYGDKWERSWDTTPETRERQDQGGGHSIPDQRQAGSLGKTPNITGLYTSS